jgi:hypothetical protein
MATAGTLRHLFGGQFTREITVAHPPTLLVARVRYPPPAPCSKGLLGLFLVPVAIGFRKLLVDTAHGGTFGALDHVRIGARRRDRRLTEQLGDGRDVRAARGMQLREREPGTLGASLERL